MQAFDALLASLDTRGTRESHLHIMLQSIEVCFKECVRRNQLFHKNSEQEAVKLSSSFGGERAESPSSVVCTNNTDALEPSISFRIETGNNTTEKKNFLKRYEDLQNWMWKGCFSSSVVSAMAYGKKRCLSLLGICDICLATYDAEDSCPSCSRIQNTTKGNFSEQLNGENDFTGRIDMLYSSPLRIRLIKAILAQIEVCYSVCIFFLSRKISFNVLSNFSPTIPDRLLFLLRPFILLGLKTLGNLGDLSCIPRHPSSASCRCLQ